MFDLKIAVVLGSTRPHRNGQAVAEWVMRQAVGRSGAEYRLIDLADHPLPYLDEPQPPSLGHYANEHTRAWAATIGAFDGFVFVTPEYNHSTSGVLKNAIDYLYHEWNDKAAAFVGYGSVGGARAIEHLRAVCTELKIAHVRQQLSFTLYDDFEDLSVFRPRPVHDEAADELFDQLETWARAMRSIRAVGLFE